MEIHKTVHRAKCPQKDHPLDRDGNELLNKGFHSISGAFGEFPKKT